MEPPVVALQGERGVAARCEGRAVGVHAEGGLQGERGQAPLPAATVRLVQLAGSLRVLDARRHRQRTPVPRVAEPHAEVLLRDEHAAPKLAELAMVVVGEEAVADARGRLPERRHLGGDQLLHDRRLEGLERFEHLRRTVAQEDACDAELVVARGHVADLHDHLGEELGREKRGPRDVDQARQEATAHLLVLEPHGKAESHELHRLEGAEGG